MRHTALHTLALAVSLATPLVAQTAPPSLNAAAPTAPLPSTLTPEKQAKIEKLMSLLGVDTQIQGMISGSAQQLHEMASKRGAQAQNDAQKAAVAEYVAAIDQAMSFITWEKVKPVAVRNYADQLTDAELDANLEFFSSPAGRSFVQKTPIAANKSVQYAQTLFGEVRPQIQAANNTFTEKMKSAQTPALSPLDPPRAPATATPPPSMQK